MVSNAILGLLVLWLIYIFSRFRPAATQKIEDNLFSVRCGFVNFYALNTTEGVLLFDTGMNAALARRGLKKLGISPDSVSRIFLTHTDFDHMGGLPAFPNASLYISEAEEQMINGQTARRWLMHNKRLSSYHTLKDGETIFAGGRAIQLHLTPGHTPGSSAYLISGRILITGDLLCLSGKGAVQPFLRVMNMDHQQDIQSIKAAWGLIDSAEYILTGHTGYLLRNEKTGGN